MNPASAPPPRSRATLNIQTPTLNFSSGAAMRSGGRGCGRPPALTVTLPGAPWRLRGSAQAEARSIANGVRAQVDPPLLRARTDKLHRLHPPPGPDRSQFLQQYLDGFAKKGEERHAVLSNPAFRWGFLFCFVPNTMEWSLRSRSKHQHPKQRITAAARRVRVRPKAQSEWMGIQTRRQSTRWISRTN